MDEKRTKEGNGRRKDKDFAVGFSSVLVPGLVHILLLYLYYWVLVQSIKFYLLEQMSGWWLWSNQSHNVGLAYIRRRHGSGFFQDNVMHNVSIPLFLPGRVLATSGRAGQINCTENGGKLIRILFIGSVAQGRNRI